jgi:hypothetical protein
VGNIGAFPPRRSPSSPSDVAAQLQLSSSSYNKPLTNAERTDVRPQRGRPAWRPAPDTVYSLNRISDRRSIQGIPPVRGDRAAYILELTRLLGTHEVPVAQWPRELSLRRFSRELVRGSVPRPPSRHFLSVE